MNRMTKTLWLAALGAAVLVACGGGGTYGGGAGSPPSPSPSPAPQRAALAVIDEQLADGSYDLLLVDLHSGARKLLDHGGGGYGGAVIAGDRVVFTRDGDLFVVRIDSRSRLRLTTGPGIDTVHALVGDRVVFERKRPLRDGSSTQDHLMSVRLDGSDEKVLAAEPAPSEAARQIVGDRPKASGRKEAPRPGGRVVVRRSRGEREQLFAVNIDGTNPVALSALTTDANLQSD